MPALNSGRNVVEFGTFVNSGLFSIKYPFHGEKNEHVRKVLRESSIHLSRLERVKGFLMLIETLAALLT